MSTHSENPQDTRVQGQAGVPVTTVQPGGVPPTELESHGQAATLAASGAIRSARGAQSGLPLPGALADRFEVVRPLARGGEGYLLLVRGGAGELRVVKVSLGSRRRDERVLELLSAEGVDVSHVVRIFEWDPDAPLPWEVMEYCEPGSMSDLLAREGGALPAEQVREVVAQVCAALEYLHGLGIWHRDLKPSNVLVRRVEPLELALADFGMSRVSEGSFALRSRVVSLGYSPPERAVSAAGDWWSLGMIVAELAFGPERVSAGEWRVGGGGGVRRVAAYSAAARFLCRGGSAPAQAVRGANPVGSRQPLGRRAGKAWLDGEDPPVPTETSVEPAAAARSVTPFPFTDPHTGRARPFTDPAELAAAMALAWEPACAVLSGASAYRVEQRALRSFLRSLGLADAISILAEQGDTEERLTRLILALDPAVAPTFRGYSIDRNGLLKLATSDTESARNALSCIYEERILLNFAAGAAHREFGDVDAEWHQECGRFVAALDEVRAASAGRTMEDVAERNAAITVARAQILTCLLEPGGRSQTMSAGNSAARDGSARRQRWFAELSHAEEVTSLGRALALVALQPIATKMADQDERDEQVRILSGELDQALAALPALPRPTYPALGERRSRDWSNDLAGLVVISIIPFFLFLGLTHQFVPAVLLAVLSAAALMSLPSLWASLRNAQARAEYERTIAAADRRDAEREQIRRNSSAGKPRCDGVRSGDDRPTPRRKAKSIP